MSPYHSGHSAGGSARATAIWDLLTLLFETGHTPGSLVGFIGGFDFIFGLGVQDIGPHPRLDYDITGGGIFPPLTSPVPDEGSSLTLIGIALPCLLGFSLVRRRVAQA
jgi:hypothetical protein